MCSGSSAKNTDNVLRSFLISIPLWTPVQVLFLWAFATGRAPWLSWADHPIYLAALVLLVPAIHGFTSLPFIARCIGGRSIAGSIRSTTTQSILRLGRRLSMHPVGAFLYHSVAFWHLVIPSNPIVALFQLHVAGFGALNGHIGLRQARAYRGLRAR